MWHRGYVNIENETFYYEAKVYEGPSEYGINGGPISKLYIKRNNIAVYEWDRGLVLEPTDDNTKAALEKICKYYK